MKKKMMVIMFALLLALPVLSFAEEKTEVDPEADAFERSIKKAELKNARQLLKKKARQEAELKRRSEKEAKKAARASRKKDAKEFNPSVSALEHADENARFKRGEETFNNKENKDIRARKREEKKEEKEDERIKKAEKDRDKGEGPFKWEF